jgi:hypothetical protein
MWVVVAVLATTCMVAVALWVRLRADVVPGSEHRTVGQQAPLRGAVAQSNPYPEAWATDLARARKLVAFPLLVPDDSFANPENMTGVFVYPDAVAVAMQFPEVAPPVAPVRQPYLEVWEQAWSGSSDPQTFFAPDLEAFPRSAALYDVGGMTVLGVMPHAPEDAEGANAAFVRFELNGVDVEISGGDSLDLLLSIAGDLVRSYGPSPSPSPSAATSP